MAAIAPAATTPCTGGILVSAFPPWKSGDGESRAPPHSVQFVYSVAQ